MTDDMAVETSVMVVGGGPTGKLACLTIASHGFDVLHVYPAASHVTNDKRTTAVMMPAIGALQDHGVFHMLESEAEPLKTLRIVDDTARLLRAPTVDFHATEIDAPAFGYNITNKGLNAALDAAIVHN